MRDDIWVSEFLLASGRSGDFASNKFLLKMKISSTVAIGVANCITIPWTRYAILPYVPLPIVFYTKLECGSAGETDLGDLVVVFVASQRLILPMTQLAKNM